MFMAGFFTRVKNCKQPKYPSADERIKKIWYISIHKILFSHKKEWSTDTCNTMHEPRKHHAK